MRGNHLVREARKRAGLTQAELASRAGTTQSAIARLERGESAPSLEHLTQLVRACGFDLMVRLVPYDSHDWALAQGNRMLGVEDRLKKMLASVRLGTAARAALTQRG